jgi:hypothetical protein
MKCELNLNMAVSYLDNELSPDEKEFFVRHLALCADCRAEIAGLENTRNLTVSTLQSLADTAEPSPQAWSRLQASIAQEAKKEKNWLYEWFSRLAPGRESIPIMQFSGEKIMQRSFVIPIVGALILAAFGFFFFNQNAQPVSAKQILEKAYEVQKKQRPASGISHIQAESFYNLEANEDSKAGTRTVFDNYYDLQTGNLRNVVTNVDSGKITEVFGYDGEFTYSSRYTEGKQSDEPLIVYRSPQSKEKVIGLDSNTDGSSISAEQMFNSMRDDPNITLDTKETSIDGKPVYVLLSNRPVKTVIKGEAGTQSGTSRMVFDAKTYQLLETDSSIEKNGKDILVHSFKYLKNEILPADSRVAWDMSDLQGIKLVDDLDRSMGDLLPEKITVQELAAHTKSAYLLKNIPAGFELTLTAPPRQDNETTYVFVASYRNASGDYFVIQDSDPMPDQVLKDAEEVFIAKSGLVTSFIKESNNNPNGKQYQFAAVKAVDGGSFQISSTLTREEVKRLIEDLEIVK